ncbi:MAG: zinc-binding dehydrogenase [Thermomicrobiales bacterium]|nr:zinc-binding dehydrogenase [Thermomicrobiales bacterium]
MKRVVFAGNSRVTVDDVAVPEPGPGDVLVRVGASAICGSEMKSYHSPSAWPGNTGHEIVGEVAADAAGTPWRAGDRVAVNIITGCGECMACRGGDRRFCAQQGYVFNGHGEYVAVPAINLMPLPDDLPYDEGVLLGGDTLGVAYHALSRVQLRPRDTVAVVGCGPVGLGFVRLLAFYGVRTIVVELGPYRRDLAQRLGAEITIDPGAGDALAAIREATGGRGVDVGIDASGSDPGVNLALDAVRDEGQFIFAGAGHKATINPWSQFLEKELTAYGVWYFVDRDYFGLLDLYRQGLTVRDLITHRFALDDAEAAYLTFAHGESGKVIFEANGK